MFDSESLKQCLPTTFKGKVSQEMVDSFNQRVGEDIAELTMDNFISYSHILAEGRYSLNQYIDAVHFCAYKMTGMGTPEAWKKVFPNKYNKLLKEGKSAKEMSSHSSSYANGKLVNTILSQAMVPAYLVNMSSYQEAINKQVDLMRNAESERVQMEAANSLLTHLKPPEVKKVELDVSVKTTNLIDELRDVTASLAAEQKRLIEDGRYTAKDAAGQKIIEAEVIDV